MDEMIVRRHYNHLRLSRHLVFNYQTPDSREPETSPIQWQLFKAKDIVTAAATSTHLKPFSFWAHSDFTCAQPRSEREGWERE
jgi:hypothetical protein